MPPKSHPSLVLFATQTLTERLGAVHQHLPAVRAGKDPKGIHQMRVASRRLRAALRAFDEVLPDKPGRRWRQESRRLTRALGAARDLDVQIEWVDGAIAATPSTKLCTGMRRLRLRLCQDRQRRQPKLIRAMDRLAESDLLRGMPEELHRMTVDAGRAGGRIDDPAIQPTAREQIERALEEMLAYDSIAAQPHLTEPLHQLRIAAKRLRYTMEVFQPLYAGGLDKPLKSVRKIQAALGDLHDMDVWIEWLPEFLEAERQRTQAFYGNLRGFKRVAAGIDHLRERCIGQRECAYEQFINLWRTRSKKGHWRKLRQTLANPPAPTPVEEPDDPAAAEQAAPPSSLNAKPAPDDTTALADEPEIHVTISDAAPALPPARANDPPDGQQQK